MKSTCRGDTIDVLYTFYLSMIFWCRDEIDKKKRFKKKILKECNLICLYPWYSIFKYSSEIGKDLKKNVIKYFFTLDVASSGSADTLNLWLSPLALSPWCRTLYRESSGTWASTASTGMSSAAGGGEGSSKLSKLL